MSAYYAAYNAAHREERRARRAAYDAARREERRAYDAAHIEERRASGVAWRAAHRDEIRAREVAYYAANRERLRVRWRAYYVAHIEERRAYNAAHREEARAHVRNRYARKRNNGGTHTAADVAAQRTRQKGRCFYCGEKVGKRYHVDHVVPLALGGSNGPENIVIACPRCNLKKNATHPMDFAGILC